MLPYCRADRIFVHITNEINHLVSPQFYGRPKPGAARLDFVTLTDRAEALVPERQVPSLSTLKIRRLLISSNATNAKNTGFVQPRYTRVHRGIPKISFPRFREVTFAPLARCEAQSPRV